MTRDEKIAAGWTETAPNVWRLPDAADVPAPDWGNVKLRSVVRATADGGYAVERREFWPNAGLRTRRTPLLSTDGQPLVVTAEQRDAHHALLRGRSAFLSLRRRHALAESVAASLPSGRYALRAFPALRGDGEPVRLGGEFVYCWQPVGRVYQELHAEAHRAAALATALARGTDAARKRHDRTRETVTLAHRRVTDRERRARERAAETAEQRAARLAAQRERQAALRARRKAEAKALATA